MNAHPHHSITPPPHVRLNLEPFPYVKDVSLTQRTDLVPEPVVVQYIEPTTENGFTSYETTLERQLYRATNHLKRLPIPAWSRMASKSFTAIYGSFRVYPYIPAYFLRSNESSKSGVCPDKESGQAPTPTGVSGQAAATERCGSHGRDARSTGRLGGSLALHQVSGDGGCSEYANAARSNEILAALFLLGNQRTANCGFYRCGRRCCGLNRAAGYYETSWCFREKAEGGLFSFLAGGVGHSISPRHR
jgi:hypothetical protein